MKKPDVCGVYTIECIVNHLVYVGRSIHANKRWTEHLSRLKHQKHENKMLQECYNDYGLESLKFSIVSTIDVIEFHRMNELEAIEAMKFYEQDRLMNRDYSMMALLRGVPGPCQENAILQNEYSDLVETHRQLGNSIYMSSIDWMSRAVPDKDINNTREPYNELTSLKCCRCDHVWHPRKQGRPVLCPNMKCHSAYWDRPKMRFTERKGQGKT